MKQVIKVQNISKKYKYGQRQPYYTLRDTLINFMKYSGGLFRKSTNLVKGEFWALNNIDFPVNEGEVLGIIGANGAGKSTLLKVLSRITPPTKGKAELKGRVGSLLEVGTGFHPELTGRENIYLNGAILGMSRKEIEAKFDEIVEFSGLKKFLDTPVKRFSSGMYVRLAFAVAAHLDLEIMLIDEVLAVGDVKFQKKCLRKMSDITQQNKRTILFVSHDMAAIKNLCDSCIVLDKGNMVYQGETDKAIEFYMKRSLSKIEIPLDERKDRSGSGDIRFTGISFENNMYSGEPAVITLDYTSKVPGVKKHIGVEIKVRSLSGEMLFSLCNIYTGDDINSVKKSGRLLCKIPSLPLDKGEYIIDIRSKVDLHEADFVENAAKFYVESGDFFGSGRSIAKGRGYFLVKHNWELE